MLPPALQYQLDGARQGAQIVVPVAFEPLLGDSVHRLDSGACVPQLRGCTALFSGITAETWPALVYQYFFLGLYEVFEHSPL